MADPHVFLSCAEPPAAALMLAGVVAATAWLLRNRLAELWGGLRARGTGSLWIVALILAVARQFEIPGVQPRGYWPRCDGLVIHGL